MDLIQNRLRRIEGQIRGLQRLLESPENCDQIIIQFQAVKSALDTCFSKLLQDNLQQCLVSQDRKQLKMILKLLVQQK